MICSQLLETENILIFKKVYVMEISKTPVIGENVNLNAAKKKLDDAIAEIKEKAKAALAEALADIDFEAPDDPRRYSNKVVQITAECRPSHVEGFNQKVFLRGAFTDTEIEICCPDTGFYVWGRTLQEAQALWDKAISKHAGMAECCLDPENHQVVYTNGMFPISRCTVCGQRNVPLPK